MSLSTSVIPVVVTVAVVGPAAVAQSRTPLVRERKARQFTLRAEEPPVLLPLHVAADEVTTVTFDAPIVPESVHRSRARAVLLAVGVHADALVLKASMDIPAGRGPVLTVRFAGPGAPTQVGFVLTTVEAEVDSQVEVFRRAQRAGLGKELADLRARCAVTEAGLAHAACAVRARWAGWRGVDGAVTAKASRWTTSRMPSASPGLKAARPPLLYRARTHAPWRPC